MKRLAVLGSTFLVVFALAGCGSDPREEAVKETLGYFRDAAANTKSVRTKVEAAVADAEKTNRTLTEKDFKDAEDLAKKLRDVGKKLLDVKGEIDILQEKTSPAQKERLDEEYGGELRGLFAQFQSEQKKLNEALAKAEPHATPAAMEQLRKAIHDSREEFRILTKAR